MNRQALIFSAALLGLGVGMLGVSLWQRWRVRRLKG